MNRKIPTKLDRALRDRITAFYQAHVDGKFRIAEQYVAADSKDIYYAAQKPRYLKFDVRKITYSDDLKKATVVVQVDMELRHHTMGRMVLPAPQESFWKIEKGQWYWYVDQSVVRTPMGSFSRNQAPASASSQPSGPGQAPRARPNSEEMLNRVTSAVRADRTEIRLAAPTSAATVVVTSSLPGAVNLKVEIVPEIPGLEAQLARTDLGPQQSTRLSLRYNGDAAHSPAIANVVVDPTGQTIPIRIVFDRAPAGAAVPPKAEQGQPRVYGLPAGAPPPAAPAQFPPELLKPAAPRIQALQPDRAVAGGASQFSLVVAGSNFNKGARVFLDSQPVEVTFRDSGHLTATVPADRIAQPRKIRVHVKNPDGTASNTVDFEVSAR